MTKRIVALSAVAGLVVALGAATLIAAEQVQAQTFKLKPGDQVPNFTMTDVSGQEHTLADHAGKVVVLDFSSQKCPFSHAVDSDLKKIVDEYKDKGVVFLSIDSHNDTPPAEIKEYADKQALNFPVLKDENNAYADEVGATRTPEILVLDPNGKLAYHGAFDNRKDPSTAGDTNYLRSALDKVLAGQQPDPQQVTPWGCTIKRK